MVIIESPWFTRFVRATLPDDEYRLFQLALIDNPEAGDLIPGARGLRKIRWSRPGMGKRGGIRVIYYYWVSASRIFLLAGYTKSECDNLTREQIRRLAEVMSQEVDDG
ncbi:MAG: type II toxin-antitoxin system RelE/ParE family toxin [Gammaproteobacteria bacterium]